MSESSALAEAYRRFSRVFAHFSDFDQFRESLGLALEQDPYLEASMLLDDDRQKPIEQEGQSPLFEMRKVTVPLQGGAEGGYLKIGGKRDASPFDAGDLHLMGSIAAFVSNLIGQSKAYQKEKRAGRILQFLVDQLPIGVLCFDHLGELVVGSSMAWQQLGLAEAPKDLKESPVLLALRDGIGVSGEAHFEVDGRLIFVMRRLFDAKESEAIAAYVLYDLSPRLEKLMDALEREYFRARCNQSKICLGLLQSSSGAGEVYSAFKKMASAQQLDGAIVQPIDAYSCAWLIREEYIPQARKQLKELAQKLDSKDLRASLVGLGEEAATSSPEEMIGRAREEMFPFRDALRPILIVLDAYRPVFETLSMLVDGAVHLVYSQNPEDALRLAESGRFDGMILDLDSIRDKAIQPLDAWVERADGRFKIFYTSTRRRSMLESALKSRRKTGVFFKPFDSDEVLNVITSEFDLS